VFRVVIYSTVFFLIVFSCVYADVLFVDDFEDSPVGKTPKKWEHLEFGPGNKEILVEIDPADKKNKAAKTTGIGLWIPVVAGREGWKDYIWDFDWMWENDSFVGTIYRVEGGLKGAEAHYHGSRRTGAVDIHIYTRKAGGWNHIAGGPYPNENEVWYTHRLIVEGKKHQLYMRERGDVDDLPPSDWHLKKKPVLEVEDATFKSGPVGMMGITGGVSYFDNMVVVESVGDIDRLRPVSPHSKLAATWGTIKISP